MLERFVVKVQRAYNDHRAPETWGTPAVSPGFFDHLRTGGIGSAWSYLVEREKMLGDPSAKPEIKAIANLVGSTLLVLGVRQMSGISNEELHEAEHLPSIKQRVGEAAFNVTLGLLFFAQDGTGYVDENSPVWRFGKEQGYEGEELRKRVDEHRKAGHAEIDRNLEEGYLTPKEAEEGRRRWDEKHGYRT